MKDAGGRELHKRLRELFEGGIDPTNILDIALFRAVANSCVISLRMPYSNVLFAKAVKKDG